MTSFDYILFAVTAILFVYECYRYFTGQKNLFTKIYEWFFQKNKRK